MSTEWYLRINTQKGKEEGLHFTCIDLSPKAALFHAKRELPARKSMKTVERSAVGGKGMNRWSLENFQAVKIFCMIP